MFSLKYFSPVAEAHPCFLIFPVMSSDGGQVLFCGRLHPPELSFPLQQDCVRQQYLPVIHRVLETLSDAFGHLR